MPSKRLIPLTEHGGEAPVLQYSPMCSVWALTTYDACDIRCSYCASYAQGPSTPRASAEEVRTILGRDLATIGRDQTICLGVMIDCYTHAEAEHQVTRAALEMLVADDRNLVIVTKGTLIERDLDLLQGYDKLAVNVSLPSLDQAVLDDIEPQADSAAQRFATIERLAEAGIDVQLHVQPWIPGMTDAKQMIEAAAGRFKVWIAPLNVQNPVIARSRLGQRFTQREINEAYIAEMKRVGPHPNVTWSRPLWLGDDLLTLSQWGVEMADCALKTRPATAAADRADPDLADADLADPNGADLDLADEGLADLGLAATGLAEDPMRRPTLPVRSTDAADREVIVARDLATTGQIIDAVVSGQMALLGMATFSAFIRVFNAPYPERALAAEGPGPMIGLVTMLGAMDEVDLQVHELRSDWPVIRTRFTVAGVLAQPFFTHEPGAHLVAEVESTYRYDTYGLLIEQWLQITYRQEPATPEPVTASASASASAI